MKKTILVTGGSGLVGSAIKSIHHNYPNYDFIFASSKMCNLLDYNQTLEFFKLSKPDYVIHLAANVGGLFKNMKYPINMLEDNLLINTNVLKASNAINIESLIACLSTCIFPDKIERDTIKESDLHKGPPHESNASYAYAKRMLQVQCDAYNKQYGRKYVCVIPTNIYGPNDNFDLENSHVIPGLIHKCFLAKESNNKFIVSGSGKPLRQFIYSEDLAKIIMWFLELNLNRLSNDLITSIILSPDESDEISIAEIAKLIAKKFNYEHMIEFDTTKSDGQYKKTVDNSLFRSFNPDYKFIDITKGLDITIDWFKQTF
jgi:GDP-L-fucose synthase